MVRPDAGSELLDIRVPVLGHLRIYIFLRAAGEGKTLHVRCDSELSHLSLGPRTLVRAGVK